jgi:hypothetical protein
VVRFEILAVSIFVAGTGAAGVKLGIVPTPDQMVQAVRALGGDPAEIKSVEINPIRAIYDNVMRQVTSPEANNARLESLGFHGSAVPPADFSAMQNAMSKPLPGAPNGFGANVAGQTQQFNNRMEDLRNYARNPAAWHGPPPQ